MLWLNVLAALPLAIGETANLPIQETLHTLLQRGVRAFSSGDYESAVNHFRALQDTFGEEPEYADASMQQLLLPLRGYAHLQTGLPGEAEADFTEFLERFSSEARQRAFVLFNLGRALRENSKLTEASDIYGQFIQEFPGKPETALALMQRADLLLQLGETDSGLALLRDLYNSKATYLLLVQARLRALQAALDNDRTDRSKGNPAAVPVEPGYHAGTGVSGIRGIAPGRQSRRYRGIRRCRALLQAGAAEDHPGKHAATPS